MLKLMKMGRRKLI